MARLAFSILGIAALCSLPGCAGDGGTTSDGAPQAALTVAWRKAPSAAAKRFGALLIEPADAIAAKGPIERRTQGIAFTYRRADPLTGFYVDVRRRHCQRGRCGIYDPIASICSRPVDVAPGETVTATVRLRSARRCTIALSGSGTEVAAPFVPAARRLTSAGFTVTPVATSDLRVSPAGAAAARIARSGTGIAYLYAFRSFADRRRAQLELLAERDVTIVHLCGRFAVAPLGDQEAGPAAERLYTALSGTRFDCSRSVVA